MDDLRVCVQPGDGLVARIGSGVMVVLPGGDDTEVATLLQLLADGVQSGDGRMVVRRLVAHLADADPSRLPSFAVLAPADSGMAVLLHGGIELDAQGGGGAVSLSGRDASTWVDRILDGPFDRLAVGASAGTIAADDRFDLGAGVVPGGGVALVPRAGATAAAPAPAQPQAAPQPQPVAQPAPPPAPEPQAPPAAPQPAPPPPPQQQPLAQPEPEPEPEPAPAPTGQFDSVLLVGASPEKPRDPLPVMTPDTPAETAEETDAPLVDGILCENGHFNHPFALYCSQCGVSTVHRTRNTVKGPRPTLGVFVLDDGMTFSLDTDYVVGREPQQDERVQSGDARPMMLNDAERSTSRIHAEVQLQQWDVQVVDRGSANGTYVLPKDAEQWERLSADRPVTIAPGTRIAFGRRVATYDHHHQTRQT